MHRRAWIALLVLAVWHGSGCTASDRDYMRNHVVQTDSTRHHHVNSSGSHVFQPDSPAEP